MVHRCHPSAPVAGKRGSCRTLTVQRSIKRFSSGKTTTGKWPEARAL